MMPHHRRILVIDDDDSLRTMMLRFLRAAGYEVQAAADGKAGVACYREQRSDIVITDIMMPESDGLQVINALRRDDAEAKIIATCAFRPS